jgi:hypothetical protein
VPTRLFLGYKYKNVDADYLVTKSLKETEFSLIQPKEFSKAKNTTLERIIRVGCFSCLLNRV